MKKYTAFLFLAVLLLATSVFAQEASPAIEQPPQWLVHALEFLYKTPYVGPVLVKIAQWFGVLVTILTALTAFLLTSISALKKVLDLAGLMKFAAFIEAFKDGKIMYWLKWGSALFNAQKPSVDEKPKA